MEARSFMSWYCSTILAVVVALFLSASLGTGAAGAGAGAGADLKVACAATPHPEACVRALQKDAVVRTGDATPRDLAEAAIRAASDAGAAAGDYARRKMDDAANDNGVWQCLNECAEDVEEALSHLDDSEGGAKLKEVKLFLDTAEQDALGCEQSCKGAADTPVKVALLAKNREFEKLMAVTLALVNRVTGGAGDDDTPAVKP